MNWFGIAATMLLASCAVVNDAPPPAGAAAELLSGRQLFGEVVTAAPAVDVLAVNAEMRAWVKRQSAGYPHARSRLRRLLQGMVDDGLLRLDYDPDLSLTAAQTFARRQGNCLSFSLLFVAVARQANLDVAFQMVEIPPSFSAQGGLVLLNNHINVVVNGVRSDVNFTRRHVVDFNSAEYNGNYDTRRVTDAYAVSLYHGNIAVEALREAQFRRAFRHLKRGLQISPEIPGLWVNLGVLYAQNDLLEMAELAYQQALLVAPRNKSALVNLANVSQRLGKTDAAARYEERVRRHLRANPYYYQYHARRALDNREFAEALRQIDRAIALKDDEHQFHHLKGLVHNRAGHAELARKSFRDARRVAHRADVRKAYTRKLEALDAGAG